jgi:hypothetical protein
LPAEKNSLLSAKKLPVKFPVGCQLTRGGSRGLLSSKAGRAAGSQPPFAV